MKVILLKDVAKVGQKFDVKDVAEGYATNFLIPKGLAEAATEQSVRKIENRKKKTEEEKELEESLITKNLMDLEGVTVNFEAKTNEKGHLFAGLHKEEISRILKEQTRLDIPAQFINLDKPIKETGEHTIEVKFGGKTGSFQLNIICK